MNQFDRNLRKKAKEEQQEIPDFVIQNIEKTLSRLPETDTQKTIKHVFPRLVVGIACFIFVFLFVFPNISTTYAQTVDSIPVIGDIVRVVTIRNYFYSDTHHEMKLKVPNVNETDNKAAEFINADVNKLTHALVEQFYKDLEISGNSGYGSIYMDYETITNNKRWFTLKISVSEIAASSNSYFKYYHIDKTSGKIVKLKDLFQTKDFSQLIGEEIKKQMKQAMNKTADEKTATDVYWINDSDIGKDFSLVSDEQNFYWNKDGNLVIVYDKYEVAPGYMGTPEFIIEKGFLKNILKPEFLNIK